LTKRNVPEMQSFEITLAYPPRDSRETLTIHSRKLRVQSSGYPLVPTVFKHFIFHLGSYGISQMGGVKWVIQVSKTAVLQLPMEAKPNICRNRYNICARAQQLDVILLLSHTLSTYRYVLYVTSKNVPKWQLIIRVYLWYNRYYFVSDQEK